MIATFDGGFFVGLYAITKRINSDREIKTFYEDVLH